MIHQFPIEDEASQAVFAAAEDSLDITIEPTRLLAAGPDCEILYKKERPVNFWLSKHHLSRGQDISIRYGMRRERIDWRTSYQRLKEKGGLEQKYSFQQRAFLELERCNILGIEMEKLSVFQNHQAADYPINHYRTELFGDGTSQIYFDLKDWLMQRGGHLLEANEYARHCQCRLDFQDILIRLVFPTRTFESYQSSGLRLTISNKRSYPELLSFRPSEREMKIDRYIELPVINVPNNYRELDLVRLLPPNSQAELREQCMLWVDRKKQMIGITDKTFANIISIEKIEGFFLQNVAPARGPGWCQFGIVHKQYGQVNLLGSAFQKLDYLQSFIEEELKLPFDKRAGGYDA